MHWIALIVAGFFEVGFTFCLNKANSTSGLTSGLWFSAFFVCLLCSMFLLYRAVDVLPMGTAYAVWTGIGAVGTALTGIIFFQDPTDFWRIFFICTLILSVIGLKVVSP